MKKSLAERLWRIIDEATFKEGSGIHYAECEESDLEFIEDELYVWLCQKLGHTMVSDQCNNPKHDYCIVCAMRAEDYNLIRGKDYEVD